MHKTEKKSELLFGPIKDKNIRHKRINLLSILNMLVIFGITNTIYVFLLFRSVHRLKIYKNHFAKKVIITWLIN